MNQRFQTQPTQQDQDSLTVMKARLFDPVLKNGIEDFQMLAARLPQLDLERQEQAAVQLSRLSREIRFRLGPPWYEPALAEAIAAMFEGVPKLAEAQLSSAAAKCLDNIHQRAKFIRDRIGG